MAWVQIGEELPIKDADGKRPEYEETTAGEAVPRPTEFIAVERWEHLEFDIDTMAKASDRRWFRQLRMSLFRPKPSSTVMAADYEDAFQHILVRFVFGIRDKPTGKETSGEDARQWLRDNFEWEDVLLLIGLIDTQIDLEASKKKNSKRSFV